MQWFWLSRPMNYFYWLINRQTVACIWGFIVQNELEYIITERILSWCIKSHKITCPLPSPMLRSWAMAIATVVLHCIKCNKFSYIFNQMNIFLSPVSHSYFICWLPFVHYKMHLTHAFHLFFHYHGYFSMSTKMSVCNANKSCDALLPVFFFFLLHFHRHCLNQTNTQKC